MKVLNEQITKVHGRRFACCQPRALLNHHGENIEVLTKTTGPYKDYSALGTKTSLKEILGEQESLREVAAYSNSFEKHI